MSNFERAVEDLSRALAPSTLSLAQSDEELTRTLSASTLFFAHLSQLSGDGVHRQYAISGAEACAQLVGRMPMNAALYGGVAGVGWLFAHLERLSSDDFRTDLTDIDDLLIGSLECNASPPYDLISGPVGLGVYFLERLPAKGAREGLRRVVRYLRDLCEQDEGGMRWRTPREHVPPMQRADFPEGKYDLGMAHGVPGVIALLALIVMHMSEQSEASAMLRDAVRWMLAQQRPASDGSRYGAVIDTRLPGRQVTARSAWCYGDPGVAAALALAARALNHASLREEARALAHHAVRCAAESSDIVDVSLCHGAAGLAHVFHMLGDTLDDALLHRSATAWHERTLAMRALPEQGIAGFLYLRPERDGLRPVADSSFLVGAAGVGLSLLSAISPGGNRSWDRLLLLS